MRDGLDVCRTLRAERDPKLRDVPIVLITGQTEPEHIAAGFGAGATDYLTKPFKPDLPRRAPAVLADPLAGQLRWGAPKGPSTPPNVRHARHGRGARRIYTGAFMLPPLCSPGYRFPFLRLATVDPRTTSASRTSVRSLSPLPARRRAES